MFLSELFENDSMTVIVEKSKVAWARSGGRVVRKFRCGAGLRKGRIVNSPADCNKPVDLKKRIKFKQTKKAKGTRITRKAARTKERDPASQRVRRLNMAANRGRNTRTTRAKSRKK